MDFVWIPVASERNVCLVIICSMGSPAHAKTLKILLEQSIPTPSNIPDRSRAAVSLVLRPSRKPLPFKSVPQVDILFIQRAPNQSDPWSAHIAFPGGRRDSCDTSDLGTAMRETREEIGLDLSSSHYAHLGRLDDRPIGRAATKSGVLTAHVFFEIFPDPTEYQLQQEEVSSAFWVSLCHLHRPSAPQATHLLHLEQPRTASLLHTLFLCCKKALGFGTMRMSAVDVLPVAQDIVVSKGPRSPPVFLWGMTLDCVGDLVTALGRQRVDIPAALPDNRLLSFSISVLYEVHLFSIQLWRSLKRKMLSIALPI